MSGARFGYVIASILLPLFIAAVWLLIAKIIPPLRRRPGIANVVAAVLVCVAGYLGFVGGGSVDYSPIFGTLVVVSLLFWNYRRDVRALEKKAAP